VNGSAAARRFDAVVVGAGVAGLTAACFLARAGRRVALLESGDSVGGFCRSVRVGGLAWDLSLYSLRGCGVGGPFTALLDELGIAERLALRHAATSYLVKLGGHEFPITTAREQMLEAADRLTPGGADRLGPFLERILACSPARDYGELSRLTFAAAAEDSGISGPLLLALAAPIMISLGLPPARASAYFAFLKYRLILTGGVSHPEGGGERLVRALEELFLSSGGSLVLGARVEAVSVEPGGAHRVVAGSRSFLSDSLVLAVDATTALSWLASETPERWRTKAAGLTPGLSASVLFCAAPGTALRMTGLEQAPQVIFVREPDLASLYRGLRAGDEEAAGGIVGLTSPAAWRPPVPPNGSLPLSAFFLAGPRAEGRATDSGELLARLHRSVPALPDGVAALAARGPFELEALTGSRGGSFCGWEMGPERYGTARLPSRVGVPGVHLAGHWTDPGPSVLNAALSGRRAALGILG
jgi:prolycopene isomerase